MNTTTLCLSSLLIASAFADTAVADANSDIFAAGNQKQSGKSSWFGFCRREKEVEESAVEESAKVVAKDTNAKRSSWFGFCRKDNEEEETLVIEEPEKVVIKEKKDSPRPSPRKPADVPELPLKKAAEQPKVVEQPKVAELKKAAVEAKPIVESNKVVVAEPAKVVAPVNFNSTAKKVYNNSSISSSNLSASSDDDSVFKVAAQPAKDESIKSFIVGENAATKTGLGIVSFVAVAAGLFL